LSQVISGKSPACATERTSRLCNSIAEDICSAATWGKWSMPKHLLLGMSLHHLTGSVHVLSIVNRYGHCHSYDKVLELDTALAVEVQRTNSVLPSNISHTGNIVSHLCWDNFDINEETPTGAGTTHTEAPETVRGRGGQANAGGARGLEYSLGIRGWGQNSKHSKNTIMKLLLL